MGLPGSGKTTLASELVPLLKAKWINNDKVRKEANDWDFSEEGRTRQAKRMAEQAEKYKLEGNYVVCDFICPTPRARELFNADLLKKSEQLPTDQEQFMLLEDLYKTVEKIETRIEDMMHNKVNIQFLQKQVEKALEDIETLKDKVRQNGNGNG